jgi:hypothetical protein
MPPVTTRDLIARFLSTHQEEKLRDAISRGIENTREFTRFALAVSRGAFILIWPKQYRPAWLSRAMIGLAAVALCLYLGFTALLYFTQRSLMYFPDTSHTTPAQAGLPRAEEVALTTSDGEHIFAWHVAPATASRSSSTFTATAARYIIASRASINSLPTASVWSRSSIAATAGRPARRASAA